MEDLARMVAIIVTFPLLISPLVFLALRFTNRRWVMLLSIPLTLISAIFGVLLLLSEIGVVGRAFGLWGILFALASSRIIWRKILEMRREKTDRPHESE
ncbi:MAG: hypothetical protein EBT44_00620 [Actinobacteria bacterium]|uniref:Uncharacterized protein n=1 Tax=Candidatus Fonsibacter lacus TaxID=2576439 RepID=A0A965GC13_9PROT|nr:hypothetical protein [Candidatus Fonsibacter lacus]